MSGVYTQAGAQRHQSFWRCADLREKLTIIIGILYILSPIDFVPEAVLWPLGLIDDAGAAYVVGSVALNIEQRMRYIKRTTK